MDFGRYGGRPHRNFPGDPFFQSVQCSLPFQTKKMDAVGGGDAGKLYSGAPLYSFEMEEVIFLL